MLGHKVFTLSVRSTTVFYQSLRSCANKSFGASETCRNEVILTISSFQAMRVYKDGEKKKKSIIYYELTGIIPVFRSKKLPKASILL